MKFFEIESREIHAWGGYGYSLVDAIGRTESGVLKLHRSGPFVPPLYKCVQHVLLSEDYMHKIREEFEGIKFAKAEYKTLYRIDWHDWNFDDPPKFIPKSGDPDDYWLELPSDSELHNEMIDSYKIIPRIISVKYRNRTMQISEKVLKEVKEYDFLTNERGVMFFVTQKVKERFEEIFGEWVRFKELKFQVV